MRIVQNFVILIVERRWSSSRVCSEGSKNVGRASEGVVERKGGAKSGAYRGIEEGTGARAGKAQRGREKRVGQGAVAAQTEIARAQKGRREKTRRQTDRRSENWSYRETSQWGGWQRRSRILQGWRCPEKCWWWVRSPFFLFFFFLTFLFLLQTNFEKR